MLTISKPLSAGQARAYHAREFASQEQNYWRRDQQGHSEWQGKLAEQWGLHGEVGSEHFARLSEGRHPETEAQLVGHQTAKTYEGKNGREVTTVEHRAGWDATFSAPKSVSLTALVGGDDRVRDAHRESVRVALGELERYTQARIGNVNAPETTGKFVAATFEHDTARPVDGYAAPQLHTHAVIFNVTERDNGQTRALQPQELFASQHYATSVSRAVDSQFAKVAAHRTRDRKELLSSEQVLQRHRELAAQHGHQADRVVAQAREHTRERRPAVHHRRDGRHGAGDCREDAGREPARLWRSNAG